MGKNGLKSVKAEKSIEKAPLSSSAEEDSPIRAIFCLKRNEDMKRFEETEDCFILEFDPFEPVDLSKLSLKKPPPVEDEAADLRIIAEKGQVACRDFPHSRHLCVKFPFNTTPHQSCCEMCYCYVCDSAAPCKYWTQPEARHCDAENVDFWKDKRNMNKKQPLTHV